MGCGRCSTILQAKKILELRLTQANHTKTSRTLTGGGGGWTGENVSGYRMVNEGK